MPNPFEKLVLKGIFIIICLIQNSQHMNPYKVMDYVEDMSKYLEDE